MKTPRKHDEAHLSFVRLLPCCICGDATMTEAAHVRYGEPRAGKRPTGMGEKPSDCWTIPLCNKHHREQHEFGNERLWWMKQSRDPIFIALALYNVTGNHERGVQIIEATL